MVVNLCPNCNKFMSPTWAGFVCRPCGILVGFNTPERQAEIARSLAELAGSIDGTTRRLADTQDEARRRDEIARRLIEEALG